MRTVTSDVQNAITADSRKMQIRATITQMRTYSSILTSNNVNPDALPEDSNSDTIFPSAVARSGSYTYTVFSDTKTDDQLEGMRSDSNTVNNLTYDGGIIASICKPGLVSNQVFYVDKRDRTFYEGDITWSTWAVSSRNAIVTFDSTHTDSTFAIHPFSSTLVAICYIHDGGMKVSVYRDTVGDGSGWVHSSTCDKTLMFPEKILDNDTPEIYYTAAVYTGTDTIVYFTSPEDGCVWGVRLSGWTGKWGDFYIALQSDLSEFRCMDAFYYNSRVLLLGQFARNGDEIKHTPVAMLLSSTDGRVMNISQYALLSRLGFRFNGTISSDTLYLSDSNRIIAVSIGAAHGNPNATNVQTTSVIGFSASSSMGDASANLELRASDESFADSATVIVLNRCKIEVGYLIANGTISYTEYDTYIIDSIGTSWADGMRTITLSLSQEAMWRLRTQTPPYYTEILGKNGGYDPMIDYSNMYVSGSSTETAATFTVDFWGAEPHVASGFTSLDVLYSGGVGVQFHEGLSAQTFKTADIKDKLLCADYPKITANPIEIQAWGWCRNSPGHTADVSVTVSVSVLLERNGADIYRPCTMKTGLTGKWTRTYPTLVENDGDYITFYLGTNQVGGGIEIGDKIKRFIVFITGPNDAYWYIERITVVGANLSVRYTGNEWTSMKIIEPTTTSVGGLELPGYGRYIMLATKPYSAFGGIFSAVFSQKKGDDCSTSGRSGYGIVILAEDGNNCVICRHSLTDSKIYIIKVRDGIETSLASTAAQSFGDNEDRRVIVAHNGGKILVWDSVFNEDYTSIDPILAYTWKESDGPMATAPEESLHSGIYMEKSPPNFRTSGFDSKKSVVIPVLIGEGYTQLDLFDTPEVGSTERCVIDGHRYRYSYKIGSSGSPIVWRGPYRYSSSGKIGTYENAGHTYLEGNYYDFNCFTWSESNASVYDVFWSFCLSSDDGFGTVIIEADLHPSLMSDGDNGPTNILRCTDRALPYLPPLCHMQTSSRMYIGPGLKKVEKDDFQETISHGYGSRVYRYATETYTCRHFVGFSRNNDMAIKDIIKIITGSVGATSTFSGDLTASSYTLSPGTPWQVI